MAAARHRAGLGTRASCSRRRHGGRSMEYGLYRCRDPAVRLADLLRRAARLAVDMARDAVQAFGGFWFTAGRSGRGHLWLSQASGCGSPAALPTPLGARHRAWRRPGVREVRPGGAVRFMLASRPRTQGRRRRRHPPHHLQDLLADVDAGQHLRDPLAQIHQRRRVLHALSLVTWILPASSIRTSALAASPPATYFSASSRSVTWEASNASGFSGRRSVVSASSLTASHSAPSSSRAGGCDNGSMCRHRSPQNLSNLTDGFLSRLICGEVRRNMTQAQWTANVPGESYQKTCSAYP